MLWMEVLRNLFQVGEQGEGGRESDKQSSVKTKSKSNLAKSQTKSKSSFVKTESKFESESIQIRGELIAQMI